MKFARRYPPKKTDADSKCPSMSFIDTEGHLSSVENLRRKKPQHCCKNTPAIGKRYPVHYLTFQGQTEDIRIGAFLHCS